MDYIIIGGGISGITIANKLNSENKILLLEKENRLGGRIYTYNNIEFGAK
jgi:protoporphyrinogen oxidase